MLQIQDTLVSLDVIEKYFCCDLDKCLGECCIEGDAGAPITPEEYEKLQEVTPQVWEYLTPGAKRVLEEQGPAYYDSDGDLVTSIVEGRDCVFTTYAPGGMCLCALEKAWREGKAPLCKPMSCHLYPIRIKELPGGITALNYHSWNICRAAELLGKRQSLRVYQFLKGPLERRFGKSWYAELTLAAEEWLRQSPK
ncbi:MAG: DUF3109 family protein [Lachnospiraceae bacterium]|nr:DUF3109 family protein [Prevotella sp.]MCM1075582.1 DUF3109 family protein [Ruminococcus sp.]MCM1222997.1 DUF3109 family protein [Lachnospiraceae bacterium]